MHVVYFQKFFTSIEIIICFLSFILFLSFLLIECITQIGSAWQCKELRSHHSILTTSKMLGGKNLKSQKVFLDLSEKWSHRTNCYPKSWRDREVETENHGSLQQKYKKSLDRWWYRKTWTINDNCWKLNIDKSERLKTPEQPTFFFVNFTSRSSMVSLWILEKNLLCFWQGERKRNHFEIQQVSFFLTKLALRRNNFTRT